MSLARRIESHVIDLRFAGTLSLMPLMVTRLVISLKKAVEAPEQMWNGISKVENVRFARGTIGGTEYQAGGDVALGNISSGLGGSGSSRSSNQY